MSNKIKRFSTVSTGDAIHHTILALDTTINAAQCAEYHHANAILIHGPNNELEGAKLHPQSALFDQNFNINELQKEHQMYKKALETHGANVFYVRDVLLLGCVDENGNAIKGEPLNQLRDFAAQSLVYDLSNLPESMHAEQEKCKLSTINALLPEELIDIIIKQPTVTLLPTTYNTGVSAKISYDFLTNLFYTRDQMITTAKGVVMCKMNSIQRQNECELMKFVLRKLGIEPIFEVNGENAFMEGGDYLVTENTSFIGRGMRTTQEAIDQLLERDLFGTQQVVVVKDKRFYQPQMHLDTYFNIIDADLVTLSEERQTEDANSDLYLAADVYERTEQGYELVKEDVSFTNLIHEMGMDVITITQKDQDHFANNYLTVAPRKIMAVANQSKEFQDILQNHGVEVVWIQLENLIKGYGAAHCMTQVLERSK